MKPPNHGMRVRLHTVGLSGRPVVSRDGFLALDPWWPGLGGRYTQIRVIFGTLDGYFDGVTVRTGDRIELLP